MKTVRVMIGTSESNMSGIQQDDLRPVEFRAEAVACIATHGTKNGILVDYQGVNETLYRTADGRLIIHTRIWSHQAGDPNACTLQEITEDDLQPQGSFSALGFEAGGRAMTLDEALHLEGEIYDSHTDGAC